MRRLSLVKKRSRLLVVWIAMGLFIHGGVLFADIKGKIAGTIKDADTNQPLPGVNVVLEGTTLGAITDVSGYYFIINVAPGNYSVKASMIGFEKVIKKDVQVSSNHTTELDFTLKPTPIEGAEVVITAQREIVKKDVSSSQIVAGESEMQSVPMINNIMSFVNMQAGISGDEIRAGGLDQIGYVVDGLVSIDNRTNRPLMQVNLSTISEISITKGGFNAEYGNLRSGLINVVTKDPTPNKYHITVDMRLTPSRLKHEGAPITSPDNFYNRPFLDPAVCWTGIKKGSWDSLAKSQYEYTAFRDWEGWLSYAKGKGMTPDQARQLYLWQHGMAVTDSLGNKVGPSRKLINYGDKPDLFGEITVSGGVPIIGEALGDMAFLVSYRSNLQAYALPTFRDYYQNDNAQIKLTSHITSLMKLGIEASYGETNTIGNSNSGGTDNDYVTSGTDIMNSGMYDASGNYRWAWWPYATVPFNIYSSMLGLTFDHMIDRNTFYNVRISGVHIKNYSGEWGPDAYRDTTTLAYFGSAAMDNRPWGFFIGSGTSQNTVGDNAVTGSAGGGQRDFGEVNTLNIKFDLTSQIDRYHQVKTGFDFTYDDLHTDFSRIRYESHWEDYNTQWNHFPYRLGAYLQDKLEFEGMIANIGIRLDYNEPNSDWFTLDPYMKYIQRKYKDQIYTSAPSEKAKGHLKISPRLGISHPISEDVKLYFSYGHFYSMPSSTNMYVINQARASDAITQLGNPNILLPRTIAYELGVDYDIAGAALLHLAGYYKNVEDQISSVTYTFYGGTPTYTTYTNNNYADIRGFEIQLERNFGLWITGFANYTYQVENHGNFGINAYFQDPRTQEGYVQPDVTREQIRPWARANLRLQTPVEWGPEVFGIQPLSDWIISPYFTWQAGSYTTINPKNVLGDAISNNVQWKSTWSVDLKINKRFSIANMNVELFADINNVFNTKFMDHTTGFSSTGENSDQETYYKSLCLPIYDNPAFDQLRQQNPGFYLPGNDQLGDVKSDDKPYIHMPSRDFLIYRDLRYVTFGIRVNL
ncbi:MAG: TonB-dependent receptor [bacterium]